VLVGRASSPQIAWSLGAAGEEAALSLIAREPSAAQQDAHARGHHSLLPSPAHACRWPRQDEHTGSFPFHLAVFHHASQPVLDALLAAAREAARRGDTSSHTLLPYRPHRPFLGARSGDGQVQLTRRRAVVGHWTAANA